MATPSPRSPSSSLSPRAKFAAGRLWVVEKFPYFRAAVNDLIVREAPGLGTLAVSEHGLLFIDFDAIADWSISRVGTAILHELGHYLRQHIERFRACGCTPIEGNLAADAELNDDFLVGAPYDPGPKTGPGAWIYPETFGAPNGLPMEAYLQYVRKALNEQKQEEGEGADGDEGQDGKEPGKGKGGKGGEEGEGEEEGDGEGEGDGDGKGQGKGGKGKPGKPGKGKGGGAAPSKPGVGQGWCGGAGGRKTPEEKDGDAAAGRSPAHVDQVRRQVAEAIRDASEKAQQGRGSVPGGWQRWADEILAPAKIDWRDKLGRVIRGRLNYVAGMVDYSYSRPSRRQAGLGYGAHSPILPALRRPTPRVAVVVDTSGSMGTDELNAAVRETRGVLMAVGSDVVFCTNDASVHELVEVRDYKQAIEALKGGGGTDFRPPFEALEQSRNRPDVIIFITDGMGPAPVEDPGFAQTIWVLVGPYRTVPHAGDSGTKITWGEAVEIEPDEEPSKGRKR